MAEIWQNFGGRDGSSLRSPSETLPVEKWQAVAAETSEQSAHKFGAKSEKHNIMNNLCTEYLETGIPRKFTEFRQKFAPNCWQTFPPKFRQIVLSIFFIFGAGALRCAKNRKKC